MNSTDARSLGLFPDWLLSGIVDAHVHVWEARSREYPVGPHDGLPVPTAGAPMRAFIAASAGMLSGAVLVQPRLYGYDHAYLYDCSAASVLPIRAVGLLGVTRPSAVDELRHLCANRWTGAVRVIALGDAPADWLSCDSASRVWAACEELSIPAEFLVDPPQIRFLHDLASRHPDLVIIVDHFGRCNSETDSDHVSSLLGLSRYPEVCMKLSAIEALSGGEFPYVEMWPLIRSMSQNFGTKRLMWGSDWPYVGSRHSYSDSPAALVEALHSLKYKELNDVFNTTARRIYRLPTTS